MRTPMLVVASWLVLAACSSGDHPSTSSHEVAFHAEQELLPAFEYDTGLQPSGSPVQVQLVVSSSGTFTADAVGVGVDEGGARGVVGKAGSGKLDLRGGLKLTGRLKVNQSGLAYDGDIPGLENASITFAGARTFDPFLLASTADVSAPVVGNLPSIPLPGGLPGTLDLTIEEGTKVDFSLSGTCAALDGERATYRAALKRSGTIRITPVVTLQVPVVGSKKFALPVVTVRLPTEPAAVDLGTHPTTFGSGGAEGERASVGSCDAVPNVGPGANGAADGGIEGGETGRDGATEGDKLPAVDAGGPPTSATCVSGAFIGTLALTADDSGASWADAVATISGPTLLGMARTKNRMAIWVLVTDDYQGAQTRSTHLVTSVADLRGDGIPRVIPWTLQRRAPLVSNGHTYRYFYFATLTFEAPGTPTPTCQTSSIFVI